MKTYTVGNKRARIEYDDDSGMDLFDLASNVADTDGVITIDGANATVALRIEATATVVPATTQSAITRVSSKTITIGSAV